MAIATKEIKVTTRLPHPAQVPFLESPAKRKIIRAGRRGGKTVGVAIGAVDAFVDGCRVLYAAPTGEQTDRFWYEVTLASKLGFSAQMNSGCSPSLLPPTDSKPRLHQPITSSWIPCLARSL